MSVRDYLLSGRADDGIASMCGGADVAQSRERLIALVDELQTRFGLQAGVAASSPGRTELGGNHTDHNHGRVLAAAVHLDCLAVAAPIEERVIRLWSRGFEGVVEISLENLAAVSDEKGTTAALIRGVAHGFAVRGLRLGGFCACVDGAIPMGAGLSSSAAFELLIAILMNALYNEFSVSVLDMALMARAAENVHFGKPCGFMDQLSCAERGVVRIDFAAPDRPQLLRVPDIFDAHGLTLCVVDTGGDHANLTPEYAAIPLEMGKACRSLDRSFARGLRAEDVLAEIPRIRAAAGDRAVLRLLHFIDEDERAQHMADALLTGDIAKYLELVRASGLSSLTLLQNCAVSCQPAEQPIPLALQMTERFLSGEGACRVHGGGFAGTIQAYVPTGRFAEYVQRMEAVFGAGSVTELHVRQHGTMFMALDGQE